MTAAATTTRRPPLWLIFAITATGITGNTLIAPAVPDIVEGLGASRSLAGLVLSVTTLPGIVLAPIAGLLADRYGRREVLVPCLVAFGVAGAAAGLAPNFGALLAARFVQGAGSAGMINLAIVLIGDHWRGGERARIVGRNSAVLTASVALLPPLGGALAEIGGFRAPFVLYPVSLVTAVAVYRHLGPGTRSEVRIAEQFSSALPYLRSRQGRALFVTGVTLFALIFGIVLTVMPLYLQDRFGLGAGARGVLLGLPAVTATLFALALGGIATRYGRRGALHLGIGAYLVALLLLAVGPSLVIIVPALLVFGVGEGLLLPTLQDTAAGLGPDAVRGTVVATFVSAARIGQTLGPLGASASFEAVGATVTFVGAAALGGVLLVGRGGRAVNGDAVARSVAEPEDQSGR